MPTNTSQYLKFNQLQTPGRKTQVWEVRSKKDDFFLGTIAWDGAWRQYTFNPTAESSKFCMDCLRSICFFMDELQTEWREQRRSEND